MTSTPATTTPTGLKPLLLLIADADPRAGERLRQHLQEESHPVTLDIQTVTDLAAARQAPGNAAPDAVLLNANLPDADAAEAVAAIRHLFPEAAIVVVAPAADTDFANRILAADGDAILTANDALPHAFLPALQQALAMRRARRCCDHLGEQVSALRERLAQTQAALTDEIDRRSRIETLFQSHRADYMAILDSAPAMIWYVDKAGTILRANTQAADSVGIPVADLIGKDYYRLFACDPQLARGEDQAIMRCGRPQCGAVTRLQDADGRPRWLRLDKIPWTDPAGRVTGITIFATDVTEARLAEEQLRTAKDEIEQINAQLRTAAEQARIYADEAIAANRIKSSFLANVTHEIRTPMNAIIGYSDLLADEQLSHEQKKYLDIIQKSAANLMALIDDVLDLSKIEAGKLDVRMRPCDPRELVTEIRDLMKHTAQRKGLALELDIAGLPAVIRTDPGRLRQCLMNLVGNALKFTDAGSVRISGAVFGTGDDPLLRIDVRDTGIGIPADKQQYIFESFAQADTGRAAGRGGTGLGLTITKRLMDLLGGTVELVSEVGKGSTFSLILPVNPVTPCTEDVPSRTGAEGRSSASPTASPS